MSDTTRSTGSGLTVEEISINDKTSGTFIVGSFSTVTVRRTSSTFVRVYF